AALGATEAAMLLLDRGADIHAIHGNGPGNATGYAAVDYQPIDMALFRREPGHPNLARMLVERGAVCDLTIAAALGDLALVTALLDEQPERIREARPAGHRPLPAAVLYRHHAIVRLLLERGADPNWPEG